MKFTAYTLAVIIAILILPGTCVRAQTTDRFADGDFQNPVWDGDTSDFVLVNGSLDLMADDGGSSSIGLALDVDERADSVVYEMLVEMDFAPSASNYCSYVLSNSNGQTVEMRMGGVSGSGDRLTVSYDDGSGSRVVMEGEEGRLGGDPAVVRWRLVRLLDPVNSTPGSPAYVWELATDYSGGGDFMTEAMSTEIGNAVFDRLDLELFYTASRSDLFSFDDLRVNASGIPTDETAPTITSVTVDDATNLTINFSEPLTNASASTPDNYLITPGGTEISSVSVTGTVVTLTFATDLPAGTNFTLTVREVEDAAGNGDNDLMSTFRYDPVISATAENIIINEFMADPSPVVGLPDAEWVELHNLSNSTLDLTGTSVASGGSPVAIPAGSRILPNGFVTLAKAEFQNAFAAIGVDIIPVNLPGLSNGGDQITLLRSGTILTELNYTDDWYNDPERNDGGYSIAFTGGGDINCAGNWRASLDPAGGTPGAENSVIGFGTDEEGPIVIGTDTDPDGITITFSEAAEASFNVISGPGLMSTVRAPSGDSYRLSFTEELIEGVRYRIGVSDVRDCSGNGAADTEVVVGIPGVPAAGDVLINEILFNPASGGSDFVELYNSSDQFFQIEGWMLSNTQSLGADRFVETNRLFGPGEYLVLTADPFQLVDRYADTDLGLVVEQTLPSLPDDEGNITVIADGILLDAFDYSDNLHSALLADQNGVSLERIRLTAATQDDSNWFSAASSAQFGTPTRPNSQRNTDLADPAESFVLVNETVSPDGDGFEDVLEIAYSLESFAPGVAARIRIYDAQGRTVRTLRQVDLLGTEGVILWDGSNDDGRRARAGIHVINIELFQEGEMTEFIRLPVVVAGTR